MCVSLDWTHTRVPQGPNSTNIVSSICHKHTHTHTHTHTCSRRWAFIYLFALVIWGPHIITLAGREPSGFVGNPHWFFCLLRLSMAAFLWLHHRIDDKDTSARLNHIHSVSRDASAFVASLWIVPLISERLLL